MARNNSHNLHSEQLDIDGAQWYELTFPFKNHLDVYNVGADVLMCVGWDTPSVGNSFLFPDGASYDFRDAPPQGTIYFRCVAGLDTSKLYVIGS